MNFIMAINIPIIGAILLLFSYSQCSYATIEFTKLKDCTHISMDFDDLTAEEIESKKILSQMVSLVMRMGAEPDPFSLTFGKYYTTPQDRHPRRETLFWGILLRDDAKIKLVHLCTKLEHEGASTEENTVFTNHIVKLIEKNKFYYFHLEINGSPESEKIKECLEALTSNEELIHLKITISKFDLTILNALTTILRGRSMLRSLIIVLRDTEILTPEQNLMMLYFIGELEKNITIEKFNIAREDGQTLLTNDMKNIIAYIMLRNIDMRPLIDRAIAINMAPLVRQIEPRPAPPWLKTLYTEFPLRYSRQVKPACLFRCGHYESTLKSLEGSLLRDREEQRKQRRKMAIEFDPSYTGYIRKRQLYDTLLLQKRTDDLTPEESYKIGLTQQEICIFMIEMGIRKEEMEKLLALLAERLSEYDLIYSKGYFETLMAGGATMVVPREEEEEAPLLPPASPLRSVLPQTVTIPIAAAAAQQQPPLVPPRPKRQPPPVPPQPTAVPRAAAAAPQQQPPSIPPRPTAVSRAAAAPLPASIHSQRPKRQLPPPRPTAVPRVAAAAAPIPLPQRRPPCAPPDSP